MSVLRRTQLPVWVETPFSCDGQGGGTTSPGRYQSRWGDHSAVMVRAEEPHHLGAASLGGDAIQMWRSGRRNHITWALPVWVGRPFSCDGQSGGTTSPGCCQSGWRRHSAVTVRTEEPHHLGVTSLGGETIQLWWSERRNHITWVLPVWVETPFSCDGQGGRTTSPGCCQSGWRDHLAVMARTEKPPSPNHHNLDVASHTGKLRKWNQSYVEIRGIGTSHLGIHGKARKWNQTFVTWKIRFMFFDRCCWPHVLRVLDLKAVTGTWTHLLEILLWAVWDNPPFPGILVTQRKWEIMRLIRNCRGSSYMSLGAWGIVGDIKGIVGFGHPRGTLDGIEVHNGFAVRSRDVRRLYGAHCGFVVCGCWI